MFNKKLKETISSTRSLTNSLYADVAKNGVKIKFLLDEVEQLNKENEEQDKEISDLKALLEQRINKLGKILVALMTNLGKKYYTKTIDAPEDSWTPKKQIDICLVRNATDEELNKQNG